MALFDTLRQLTRDAVPDIVPLAWTDPVAATRRLVGLQLAVARTVPEAIDQAAALGRRASERWIAWLEILAGEPPTPTTRPTGPSGPSGPSDRGDRADPADRRP